MRGKPIAKRAIQPDSKFHDLEIAKFINYIMRRGKKSTAQSVVYRCFDLIKEKTKQDPRAVFQKAVKQVSPLLEVRGRRVGGANYQIPFPVRGERRFTLACRWMIAAAKSRKGKSLSEKLAEEIIGSAKGESAAIKKRNDVHRMAESNKAFAHFAR